MEKNFNLSLDGIQCDQMYNNKKSPNFAQKLPQNSHSSFTYKVIFFKIA